MMSAIRDCVVKLASQDGWNMQRLAGELGVHYESLRRLKAGRFKEPPFYLVSKIFKMAGESLDELVGIEAKNGTVSNTELQRLKDENLRQHEAILRLVEVIGNSPSGIPRNTEGQNQDELIARADWTAARQAGVHELIQRLVRMGEKEQEKATKPPIEKSQ